MADTLPVKVSVADGKLAPLLQDEETRREWVDRLKDALGTESEDLAWYGVATLFKSCQVPETLKLNAMIEQIRGGCPRDPQEMVLLIQMAAVAQRMQEAIASEVSATSLEDRQTYATVVRTYGKLYARQLEALRKYRRDGNQTITVVHAENAVVGVNAR